MKRFYFLTPMLIITIMSGLAQNSLDELNIILKNDFESNTVGIYSRSEWEKDWSYPTWDNRLDETEIAQNPNDQINSSKVLQYNYPDGSLGPLEGGGQWWSYFKKLDELYVSYDLMFMPGFMFQKGGKLPSVQGGDLPGFDRPTGYNGFTGGLMFSGDGSIRFYVYYPDGMTDEGGTCFVWGSNGYTDDYFLPSRVVLEYSSMKPSYTWTGQWHNITYRIVLNTVKPEGGGNYDGILEGYFDGELVMQVSHLLFRHTTDIGIDCMRMYTFFGGGDDSWRNPIKEWLKIDNVLLYTFKDNIDVPRGNVLSPTDRKMNYWKNFQDNPTAIEPPINVNHNPVIHDCTFDVEETQFADNLIGKVNASDEDAEQQLIYSISSGNESGIFVIESQTGELKSTSSDIFGTDNTVYKLSVKVTDNGQEPKSATAIVTVNLIPEQTTVETPVGVNHIPIINDCTFNVQEASFTNNLIGTVSATDKDAGQQLTYSISSGNESGMFIINSQTGELKSTSSDIFNKDKIFYQLSVKVTDDGEEPESSTALVTVNLLKKNVIFYIDPTNTNDDRADGTIEHPFSSWNEVEWKEGNTYLQKKGTTAHESKINIFASGVVISAYGEGEMPIIISDAKDFAFRAYEKSNVRIEELNIIAESALSCIYFMGSTSENITIENCIFEKSVNGIRIIDGNDFTICYNSFIECSDAIYSYAKETRIFYNIFKNNITAINIISYESTAEIYNNVFYENKEGVSVSYAKLTLYNNIFYLANANDRAINIKMDNLISDNNIFYPEQSGFISVANFSYSTLNEYQNDIGADLNSLTTDPKFKDALNNNFTVDNTSPAIDAGKIVGLNADFYGSKVPYGNAPDIGLTELPVARQLTGLNDLNGLDKNQENIITRIFPNPSNGTFFVQLNLKSSEPYQIIIRNLAGKTIYENVSSPYYQNATSEIDISDQPNGIYLITIKSGNKNSNSKIILN